MCSRQCARRGWAGKLSTTHTQTRTWMWFPSPFWTFYELFLVVLWSEEKRTYFWIRDNRIRQIIWNVLQMSRFALSISFLRKFDIRCHYSSLCVYLPVNASPFLNASHAGAWVRKLGQRMHPEDFIPPVVVSTCCTSSSLFSAHLSLKVFKESKRGTLKQEKCPPSCLLLHFILLSFCVCVSPASSLRTAFKF